MPTIKLSKTQWELIGKKTGWMKKANESEYSVDKLKELFKSRCPKWLYDKMPAKILDEAFMIIDNIQQGKVTPESQGIDGDSLNRAKVALTGSPKTASVSEFAKYAQNNGLLRSVLAIIVLGFLIWFGYDISTKGKAKIEQINQQNKEAYEELSK